MHPGSSGSPVFSIPTFSGEVTFLGVITQTMIKGHQLLPISDVDQNTATNLGVRVPIGLGIVLKPTLLTALIDATIERWKQHNLEAWEEQENKTDEPEQSE